MHDFKGQLLFTLENCGLCVFSLLFSIVFLQLVTLNLIVYPAVSILEIIKPRRYILSRGRLLSRLEEDQLTLACHVHV